MHVVSLILLLTFNGRMRENFIIQESIQRANLVIIIQFLSHYKDSSRQLVITFQQSINSWVTEFLFLIPQHHSAVSTTYIIQNIQYRGRASV